MVHFTNVNFGKAVLLRLCACQYFLCRICLAKLSKCTSFIKKSFCITMVGIRCLMSLALTSGFAYAAQINQADSTWGPLMQFVLELFTGDPAIIASLIAFFMGIILAMRTQHKLAALSGGLIIAVAFQIGPNIVEHLTGAII